MSDTSPLKLKAPSDSEINPEGLRRYDNRIAHIEWLLVALVLLYSQIGAHFFRTPPVLLLPVVLLAGYILLARYCGLNRLWTNWDVRVDAWVMTAFTTAAVGLTGGLESPLLSLYFVVIGASAIMLSAPAAFAVTGVVSLCCGAWGWQSWRSHETFGPDWVRSLLILFSFWLVAYLAATLSKEKGAALKKIFVLSHTDEVTGLWNMKMFTKMANQERGRSIRYQRPFTLVMLDADNLKKVNDRYGHRIGGLFIKHLADCLSETLRESDMIARYGGDEFAIMLPETDSQGAALAMERVRQVVERSPLMLGDDAIRITISIGIATYPDHGFDVDEILHEADQAMYRGKTEGKNRVEIARSRPRLRPVSA